ncbi:Acyl carrier protein [Anaerovibrio lipolyticus DSM 3074]|uniref:Acyl carrier protein n=1 Tax=Anaerovibrio lipolyticus DSM 3074 TaxID=1120997 RepID=A0A1M6FE80_9FIRM|nr:acyl carrier protein [Anaerovibrio lipolyticus]SHI95987.1 Acyl carrier protein [Anaerovibrio lipolyticus DSM 3074]
MNNIIKYNKIFANVLGIRISDTTDLDSLIRNEISAWDSLGHISLVTSLEKEFSIRLEPNDIKNFTSYQDGIEILHKHDIEL